MAIGDSTGQLIYLEPGIMGARDKQVAWILVAVDFVGGLTEDIDLEWGSTRIHE